MLRSLTLTLSLCLPMELQANERPNIVLILADDLGWGDVRANNPDSKIPTPVIDRLARDGMRFTDAHSGSAVCTPTRYGLLTGRHSWRTRLKQGVLGGLSPHLIEPERPTIASFLKGIGYLTACVGKWHLGMDWVLLPGRSVMPLGVEIESQVNNVDYTQPISHGPTTNGFDSFFGIAASLDMVPYTYIVDQRVQSIPTKIVSFPMVHGGTNPRMTRRGPGAPDFSDEKVLPDFIHQAISVIDRAHQVPGRQPFFLYLPLAAPHTPIAPSEPFRGASQLTPYADFLMQTDAAIGQIMDTIDRHGSANNTIVILSSDNGFAPMAGTEELESKGHRPSGPFRGYKADLYEGGHRVPLIIRWPAVIKPNTVSSSLVCLNDLFATLADATNTPLPPHAAEDSVSFWNVLTGKGSASRRELVSQSQNGSLALRDGDWKFLQAPGSGGWSYPRPGVDNTSALPPVQLFNLKNDIAETKNLAIDQPDIVDRLRRRLDDIRAGQPDTARLE